MQITHFLSRLWLISKAWSNPLLRIFWWKLFESMLALLLHSSSYLLYVVRNRPVFASSKRCGASLSLNRSDQPRHKQSKTSNGSDQDTDRKKTQSLGTVSTYIIWYYDSLFLQESEIKLLTENLKYVSKERDQLRLGLDNARWVLYHIFLKW